MTDDLMTLRVFAVVGFITVVIGIAFLGLWLMTKLSEWINQR